MKILGKKILTGGQGTRIIRLDVSAPEIAKNSKAGQFVVLMVKKEGERIPLTIVDTDDEKGALTLIVQEAGLTTVLLGRANVGDELYSLAGPLGHPTQIKKYGRVIVVGGGVGIAEIYPVAKALKGAGNDVIAVLGTRTKDLLILEDEMKEVCDQCHVMTDDGSTGRKGFTTDMLKELLERSRCDLVYAVGPLPMMKKVALVTSDLNVPTLVSLNAIMVDGTGMCGCCRVSVAGETRFSCVDGPEFDAQAVDWDELMKRNNIYAEKEKHICRLNNI